MKDYSESQLLNCYVIQTLFTQTAMWIILLKKYAKILEWSENPFSL